MSAFASFILALLTVSSAFAQGRDYSAELKKYVSARVEAREGGESLKEMLAKELGEPKKSIVLKAADIQCLGVASVEGNNKSVGVCIIESSIGDAGAGITEYKHALTISDDQEHPGEMRSWALSLISYDLTGE